jgi:hypothetical protein
MAAGFQSIFANSTPSATSAGDNQYHSIFGSRTVYNPSPTQVAQQRAQNAKNAPKPVAAPTPAPKPSLLNRIGGAAADVGKAAKAVVKPAADVFTGQGGKTVHDTAQLSSDVTGGTANQFSKAVVNVPQAVKQEVQNKPITNVQQKVFGTTNPGNIVKKIVGSTAGTASLFAGGGEAAGVKDLLTRGAAKVASKQIAKDAAIGAVGNTASTVTSNPDANLKQVGKSAAIGGLIGGAAPVVANEVGKATNNLVDKVVNSESKAASIPKSIINTTTGSAKQGSTDLTNAKTNTLLKATGDTEPVKVNAEVNPEHVKQGLVTPDVKQTPISDIHIAADQAGKKIDTQKVAQYTKQIKDGEPIEPVVTHDINGVKTVVDGQHKLAAAQKAGATTVPTVDKVPGAVPIAPLDASHEVPSAKLETPDQGQVKSEPSTNPTPKAATVTTPETTKAVVDPNAPPEKGTSKIAQDIQSKAVASKLHDSYGEMTQYNKINVANEADKAVKFVNGDKDTLDKVISGEQPLPTGLRATAVIKAVEEHPTYGKDPEVLRSLAKSPLNSEASHSAQELRLAAERDQFSPVRKIGEVQKTREEAFTKKTGKTPVKAVNDEVKQIRAAKATVPKPTKETFSSFVDSLRC